MGVEAVYSSQFSSTINAPAYKSSSPITLDLVFEDGHTTRLTRRASDATSKAGSGIEKFPRKMVSGTTIARSISLGSGFLSKFKPSKEPSLSSSFLRRTGSRSLEGCSCRASFFEDLSSSGEDEECGYGLLTSDSDKQSEGTALLEGQREGAESVFRGSKGPSFGFGGPQADDFQWTPSPSFGEGFQARISALRTAAEEKRLGLRDQSELQGCPTTVRLNGPDSSRSCPGQVVESSGGTCASVSSKSRANALCGLSVGDGVQLPNTLRMRKRRNGEVKGVSNLVSNAGESACAIRSAFSSMVYMIKAVQSYALRIREALFSEWDVQEVLLLVHREMQASFVWLFQQVFACTPKLMVSVMILLANFTVFSMGENIALAAAVFETPAPIAAFLKNHLKLSAAADSFTVATGHGGSFSPLVDSFSPDVMGGCTGGNNSRPAPVAGGQDGDSWHSGSSKPRSMFSEKESTAPDFCTSGPLVNPHSFQELPADWKDLKVLLEMAAKELELKKGEPLQYVKLDQEIIRRLVAPVVTMLEPDNYLCFDRTDLEYQHAISMDPGSPLLLANYAQFLYVVRHDNDRAEKYFHRAMQADPWDADVLGRFASFLWLARGDRPAAERAYKAALISDPGNPFHAGSYAHFLWHAGDEELPARREGPKLKV